jgi:hypothetical protein
MGGKSANPGAEALGVQSKLIGVVQYTDRGIPMFPPAGRLTALTAGDWSKVLACSVTRGAEHDVDWMLNRKRTVIELLFQGLSTEGSQH